MNYLVSYKIGTHNIYDGGITWDRKIYTLTIEADNPTHAEENFYKAKWIDGRGDDPYLILSIEQTTNDSNL